MESKPKANPLPPAQSYGYDCALCKEELRPVYNTLVTQNLIQNNKSGLDFDSWYAILDTWNRTIIYASQLKNYLINVGYSN